MSNFKVWIDSPMAGTNVQSAATFLTDGQRIDGFEAGDAASAIRVNSALRQANLISVALIESIIPNTNLDLTSSVADLVDELLVYFNSHALKSYVNTAVEELSQSISTLNTKVDNLRTIVRGVLPANTQSVVLTDNAIKETSIVSCYTEVWGFNPDNVVVSNGSATLYFEAQTDTVKVALIVEGDYVDGTV